MSDDGHQDEDASLLRSSAVRSESAADHYALGSACIKGGHPFAARLHFREARRIESEHAEYETAFVFADQCCRLVYLPQYYLCHVLNRIPGRGYAVLAVFVLGILVARWMDVPRMVELVGGAAFFVLYFYTWVADKLVEWWVRRFPPR